MTIRTPAQIVQPLIVLLGVLVCVIVGRTSHSAQVSAAANVAYAGDLQGNVWRVDITAANPANWIVSVMFQTTDPSGAPQPITTVPADTGR